MRSFFIIDTFWPHPIEGPFTSAEEAEEAAEQNMPDGSVVIIVEHVDNLLPIITSWAAEEIVTPWVAEESK